MQDSFESFVATVGALGEAIIAPGSGVDELLVAGLVAIAFLVSGFTTLLAPQKASRSWQDR